MSKAAIQSSTQGFSIESVPKDARRIEDFRDHLPLGTEVYVAWLPNGDPAEMVFAASKLSRQGMIPVPHIPARRIESEAVLWQVVKDFVEQAGVTRLLLLGGDPDDPVGPYADASALLQSGVLEAFNIKAVDIAAHPDGHPVMSTDTSAQVLREKIAKAQQAGINVRVVSQFALDPSSISDWHAQTYTGLAQGTALQIGIPGVVSTKRLLQMAGACGIAGSFSMLRKSGRRLAKTALGNGTTETLVTTLAPLVNQSDDINGFHFYSFGNFEKTAAWARAVSSGEFSVNDDTISVDLAS